MSPAAGRRPMPLDARTREMFAAHELAIAVHTDRLFAGLMVVQWCAAIAAAQWITPRTWTGTTSHAHLHVSAAVYLGGLITLLPVALALSSPGRTLNRYVISASQVLMSSLLIHFTGGRIETHFHVFASLVFLSFYRDWRVLVPATILVAADHFVRGVYWPQSVFGVLTASPWRWMEHAAWVLFEDVFLVLSCIRSRREMWSIAERSAALVDSEARYKAIVDRAEGIFLADASSKRLLECNSAFLSLLGYTATDVHRLTIYDIDDGSREEVAMLLGEVGGDSGPIDLERRYKRSDGTTLDVAINLSALVSGGGLTLCGTVRDVTDHRRAEEALRRSEDQLRQAYKMEAVGKLAGGIAHDFNNLLTAILGYTEVLAEDLGPDHPSSGDVAQIGRAGRTAASLTQQLLAFSRRQVLKPVVLDLNAAISSVEQMLRRLLGEHVDLSLTLAGDLRRIQADPTQVEQVILNLAVNARDAMRDGGRLTIETRNVDLPSDNPHGLPGGSCVMLAIADTGCGMDAEVQKHLFEPFFTTKGPGKGTGLGLSTVYGIVKQSGGSITVESVPGAGTTFRIILPGARGLATKATGSANPTAVPGAAPWAATVLLVEDEDAVRALSRRALERAGFVVLEAAHPEAALKLVSTHAGTIDLIVTDVVMPGMSGRMMVDRLAPRYPQARVLFMSGYTEGAASRAAEAGEQSLLQKPFTPSTLVRRVRDVMERPLAGQGRAAAAGRLHAVPS